MFTKIKATVWEVIKLALFTLIIVVPIRTYVAQPFIVSGASMDPTFRDHEYLIVDELSYYLRTPARGEVVIFRYPKDPSKFFIKRIIGLPGETVAIQQGEVVVKQNGTETKIAEPYLHQPFTANAEVTLGATDYFVMGDNRNVSYDSRSWGALPKKMIVGRALLRLFPPQRIALLPGAVPINIENN